MKRVLRSNPFRRRDGSGNGLVHIGGSLVVGDRRLRVSAAVAEGGSAFIYKVKDQATGGYYALKQLILADSDEVELQYVYEKSTLEALRGHPNVIRLYEAMVIEVRAPGRPAAGPRRRRRAY